MTISEEDKIIAENSISVGELIELLSKYPRNMKIVTTWESTIHEIAKRDIYLAREENFIYLDADGCFYKERFAKDPKENE